MSRQSIWWWEGLRPSHHLNHPPHGEGERVIQCQHKITRYCSNPRRRRRPDSPQPEDGTTPTEVHPSPTVPASATVVEHRGRYGPPVFVPIAEQIVCTTCRKPLRKCYTPKPRCKKCRTSKRKTDRVRRVPPTPHPLIEQRVLQLIAFYREVETEGLKYAKPGHCPWETANRRRVRTGRPSSMSDVPWPHRARRPSVTTAARLKQAA